MIVQKKVDREFRQGRSGRDRIVCGTKKQRRDIRISREKQRGNGVSSEGSACEGSAGAQNGVPSKLPGCTSQKRYKSNFNFFSEAGSTQRNAINRIIFQRISLENLGGIDPFRE